MNLNDLSKYNTFHLEYYKTHDKYQSHVLRPSLATYDHIISNKSYIVEGGIKIYDHSMSLNEIVLNATIAGMVPDFISIYVDSNKNKYGWNDPKCIQFIDTHKYDMSKIVDIINLPRFYVAKNIKSGDLPWLIIDRHTPKSFDDFLSDKYSDSNVYASFSDYDDAVAYAVSKNSQQ